MEGQNQLIKLTPYFPPKPAPGGFHTRRLTRHGFLSNRWGVQHYRASTPSSIVDGTLPDMLQGRTGLPAARWTEPVMPAKEVERTLDHNFRVLQRDFHGVEEGIRRLEKTTENISKQVTQGLETFLSQQADQGLRVAERMEKEHDVQKTHLKLEHYREIESLQKTSKLDKKRLSELEKELEIANLQAQIAANELTDAHRMMDAQSERASTIAEQEYPDIVVQAAFLRLRDSVVGFAGSSATQLGDLPATPVAADSLFHPQSWNRASSHQRRRRVMAKVFHLLFRRILRPGLRTFGVQAFIKSGEHSSISASEAYLRALERELEAQGVENTTLSNWITTTIDIAEPLRDIPHNTEGITQEIVTALAPVMRFTFSRNADKAKTQISAICEDAVRLKLAMRRAPCNYKIEVPSRDAKKWGEPGCDSETRALASQVWLQIIDHETRLGSGDEWEVTGGTRSMGDTIACIPFGALTKLKEGVGGEQRKVILEKGWVVAKAEGGKLKRKAPTPAGEEQVQKRVNPNRGVSPRHLARVKASMGK